MSMVNVERREVIASGAYADILALGGGRVLKAFRRKSQTAAPVLDWADHDAMTRAEFRAEARSYERLAAFPELELFAPRYFGRANPLDLLSEVADSPSRYVAGCGIVLEQIPGAASKLVDLEPSLQLRVEALLERYRDEVG